MEKIEVADGGWGFFYLLLIGIRATLFGFRKWLVLVLAIVLVLSPLSRAVVP